MLHILHCPLSGPELIYISLRIIFCIIVYVTNKKEPWTFNNLVKKYNLKGKYNFLKYLQIRYCVSTKIQHTDGNYILDFLSLPRPQQKASVFYRMINHVLSNDCINLKTTWEKDIGIVIRNEEWNIFFSNTGKYVREAKGQFTQYKTIHRFYLKPIGLNRMVVK